eukprot:g9669.t1
MANYPGRTHYEDPQSEDDEAIADSGHELKYRRLAGGGVATMPQPNLGFGPESMSIGGCPADPPALESDSSAEPALWQGAKGAQLAAPRPYATPGAEPRALPSTGYGQVYDFHIDDSPPGFFAPFGSVGKSTTEDSSSYDEEEESDTPCVITLPSTFRLERTNFVVTSSIAGVVLPALSLVEALRSSLKEANVDVLEFMPAICVLECSYHVGNRFLKMNVRVFGAPDRASGQLLDAGTGSNYGDEDQIPYVVEAQLREGDRLHFSALFREIMREFKNQEGVNLAGTFRYHPRPYPAMGEGLALEEASMAPSRNSIRLLAEREETRKSDGAGLGVSPPPVPASMAKTQEPSELDEEMLEDVILLATMLRGNFVDVQADAATALAGLTADPELLKQLSRDSASKAAIELCTASARLLVETQHRAARRQAAVVVANLATSATLRLLLLASDNAVTPGHPGMQRRLVESLVVLSIGTSIGGSGTSPTANKKEEEIGMRRECMRALVGLAHCHTVRYSPLAQELLSTDPSGRGAKDNILLRHLHECRTVSATATGSATAIYKLGPDRNPYAQEIAQENIECTPPTAVAAAKVLLLVAILISEKKNIQGFESTFTIVVL